LVLKEAQGFNSEALSKTSKHKQSKNKYAKKLRTTNDWIEIS